ncbi:UNVERIFIED_ORG: phage gp29-like protein [Rhizobium etli]
MASFRDWLGRIVLGKELMEQVADARVGSMRNPFSGHPADGMTPQRLASILRAAANGEPEAYFELAEDIEERDLHYAAVLATRKRSVSQLPVTVKAASDSAEHKKHAALVQSWIDDGVLQSSLFDMLDAVGKGLSVTEIDWQYRLGSMLPRDLTWRTQRWFTFDQEDGETVLLREGVVGAPLAPHKFIIHRHKTKSGLTIRSGIARVACWAWMFKSFTIKDWAIFAQNYGQPIRLGRYGPGATEAQKDVLWRAVSSIAGDCAAIIPRDMLVEFVDVGSKSSSTDMYERRADWLDRQISKLVLGQTTTTDAISGGHAVSQEHRLVQEDIERSDAMCLTGTVNSQLIPNIIAFNFGPQDHYPQVKIGRPDELPIKDFAEAFDKLAKHGLTAEESFLQDRMGIPAPKKGSVLIGGRKPEATPGDDPATLPAAKDRPEKTVHSSFKHLFERSAHARSEGDDVVDRLADRLERDAAGAMAGMIDEVKAALMQASDLRDAAERLALLELAPDELAEAMARGMALAHLAGQAALLDDLKG